MYNLQSYNDRDERRAIERRIPNVNRFCRLFQRVCPDDLTIAGLSILFAIAE